MQTDKAEETVIEIDDGEDGDDFSTGDAVANDNEKEDENNDKQQDEADGNDDYVAMFGGDDDGDDNDNLEESSRVNSSDDNPVAKKRQKTGDDVLDSTTLIKTEETKEQEEKDDSKAKSDDGSNAKAFNLAKSKLSKWASRLFDPNRPRGLIEPPQTIPLNDEFLTAFGKREKEFDKTTGRDVEIDKSNLDEVEHGGKSREDAIDVDGEDGNDHSQKKRSDSIEGCKVKITNIAYMTTLETLTKKVQKYGSIVEVNLIMDKDKPGTGMNIGKAYVTFELPEYADDFVKKMNDQTLDGRAIRVGLATAGQRRKATTGSALSRYWEKDISTKCFRCGQVGHMESNCPNEEKPRPCPLCAELGHDTWSCSKKNVCFNCGVPGHVSRECWERRGMPKRTVCGNCFQSGHHRWNCMEKPWNIPSQNAKCIVCGQLGHFSCQPMRWFFGLKNNYCFNCGQVGHHGINCDGPTLEVCAKNSEITAKEIERAEAFSLSEELSNQQQARRGRQSDRGRSQNINERNNRQTERPRAKSQPPQISPGEYGNRPISEPQFGYNQPPPYGERRRGYSDSDRSERGGRSGRGNQRVSRGPRNGRSPGPNKKRRGYN